MILFKKLSKNTIVILVESINLNINLKIDENSKLKISDVYKTP